MRSVLGADGISHEPSADFDCAEIVKIGRVLARADFAEYLQKVPKGEHLVVTAIPADTTFEMTAGFKIVYEGFSRMFVDDLEMAVLRDSQSLVSTIEVSTLEPCRE